MLEKRPHTVILDIDGVLIWQGSGAWLTEKQALAGTVEKLQEWDGLGYHIILLTGRRESLRVATEQQLLKMGIFYDTLVMNCGSGRRFLVNDLDPKYPDIPKAVALNLHRNEGIKDITI